MSNIRKWNLEKCKEIALLFPSRVSFQKAYPSTYASALKNSWVDDICKHMKRPVSSQLIWTKEKCKEESLKYNSRSEFEKGSISAYNSCKKNKWMDEICSHMIKTGHKYKRMVYVYEFSDNCVYIGLTMNIKKRNLAHLNDSGAVYNHIQKTKLVPELILSEYIDAIDAQKLECDTIIKYKNNNWNILNKKRGGDLGGNNIKWTYEKCEEEALKFNTKKDFVKNSNSCYNICLRNGWMNKITNHYKNLRKIPNYWTYEKCEEEAMLFSYKNDFRLKSNGAYTKALKNKWLDDICKHMTRKPKTKKK